MKIVVEMDQAANPDCLVFVFIEGGTALDIPVVYALLNLNGIWAFLRSIIPHAVKVFAEAGISSTA